MAHFAKLGINGKVIAIQSLDNNKLLNGDNLEDETVGQQELERIHGWPASMWIQTSYNTKGGKYYNADGTEHSDQSKAFRKNFAGLGFSWDENNEIFWPEQSHTSWSKNMTTGLWDPPITYPSVKTYVDDTSTLHDWIISWNETGYQADNTKGWEALKVGSATVWDWNGSAWVSR